MMIYTFTKDELSEVADIVMTSTIAALERDGRLINEYANDARREYTVIVHHKGWLDRLFGDKRDANKIYFKIAKLHGQET